MAVIDIAAFRSVAFELKINASCKFTFTGHITGSRIAVTRGRTVMMYDFQSDGEIQLTWDTTGTAANLYAGDDGAVVASGFAVDVEGWSAQPNMTINQVWATFATGFAQSYVDGLILAGTFFGTVRDGTGTQPLPTE